MENRAWQRHYDYNVPLTIRYPRIPAHHFLNIPASSFPDTDARIVDIAEGEADVAQGQPGELIIRSPLTMKEYWNNPEATAGQLKNGWLYTGDIVVQDEDDYFAIVDRKKDMIIAGGYNVYQREINEVLYQHPKIADAVAVGIPDEYRGETVKAFVVAKAGETLTEEDVIGF